MPWAETKFLKKDKRSPKLLLHIRRIGDQCSGSYSIGVCELSVIPLKKNQKCLPHLLQPNGIVEIKEKIHA
jgi:hypothetical protein